MSSRPGIGACSPLPEKSIDAGENYCHHGDIQVMVFQQDAQSESCLVANDRFFIDDNSAIDPQSSLPSPGTLTLTRAVVCSFHQLKR